MANAAIRGGYFIDTVNTVLSGEQQINKITLRNSTAGALSPEIRVHGLTGTIIFLGPVPANDVREIPWPSLHGQYMKDLAFPVLPAGITAIVWYA